MSTFKDPRNGRWRYRFGFRGRRYKGSAPRERNLERVATALEKQHLDRLVAQRWDGDMPTVATFVETFLNFQAARVKPLTFELQQRHLKKHVEPHLGKKKLDQVGSAELAHLVTKWKAAAGPRTINTRLGTVLRMFGVAVEWGMLPAAPRATFLKVPKDTPRFLSPPEAEALLAASLELKRSDAIEWWSMLMTGLKTGMRVGELRGLKWADADLERGMVYVRRTDPGRSDVEATSPKGGRGRPIPLTPDALACLRARLAAETARRGRAPAPDELVWPGAASWRGKAREQARSETNCKNAITKFAKRAGLADVGWHTLRHTFASWLVMRGVPLRAVQDLLGHASIKQTERYSHLAPGFINHNVVASLDLPIAEAPSSPALPPGNDEE